MRLIDFIAKRTKLGKRHAKNMLGKGNVILNGDLVRDGNVALGKFDHVIVAGETLQYRTHRIVLINKPTGVLSATTDPTQCTVIDLIREPWAHELHLAGRLDRTTTGLVILTNDSTFSESLTRPRNKVSKAYLVETDQAITTEAMNSFRKGMSFAKERICTQPAIIVLLSETSCRLTIYEGKHHQIKRMFLRFGIRVTKLHRESVGSYMLPDDLAPGEYRTSHLVHLESCTR